MVQVIQMPQDPRLAGMGQVGQQFGGDLGDALAGYLINRRMGKALSGITAQTPVNEVLQRFTEQRIPQAMQQQYFSPAIQQRMQAQGAADIIRQAVMKPGSTPQDTALAVLQAQAMTGSLSGAKDALDLVMGGQMADYYRGGAQQPGAAPAGIPGLAAPSGVAPQPPAGAPQQPGAEFTSAPGFPGVLTTGLGGPEVYGTVPATSAVLPFTEAEKNEKRARLTGRFGAERGLAIANQEIADREAAVAASQAQLAQYKEAQNIKLQRKEEFKAIAQNNIARDFAGNRQLPAGMMDMVVDLGAEEMAKNNISPDTAYQRVSQKHITPIINMREAIEKNVPVSNLLGPLESPKKQKALKNLSVMARQYIDLFPPEYKQTGYDTIRSTLGQKYGLGPVSVEYVVNPPSEEFISAIKSLGTNPVQTFAPGIRPIVGAGFGPSQQRQERLSNKLANILVKQFVAGQSPKIAKDFVVTGLGWSDDVYDNAQAKALEIMREKDLSVPLHNQQQLNETLKKFAPSPVDSLGGHSLLGLMEVHR